jgi:hypothetical protein
MSCMLATNCACCRRPTAEALLTYTHRMGDGASSSWAWGSKEHRTAIKDDVTRHARRAGFRWVRLLDAEGQIASQWEVR